MDDYRTLERYRYDRAVAIGLLLPPRVPGIGGATNGAYLAVEHRAARVPARRVRQDRHRHLPGQLPERRRDVLVKGRVRSCRSSTSARSS